MTRISLEESDIAGMLQTDGMDFGALHIATQRWTENPTGRLFSVIVGETSCGVWLAESEWLQWCEGTLGTSSDKEVDPQLLAGIAEWGLLPLLQASGAKFQRSPGGPCHCSMLSYYLGVVFTWQIDGYSFHCVLFGWPDSWFRDIAQQITPSIRPTQLMPSVPFACYAGWCQASLGEIKCVSPGVGLRMSPFGHPRDGEFVVLLATGYAVRIRIEQEGDVKIEGLVDDIERLLDEEGDDTDSSSLLPCDLDALPQKLMVEVGQVDIAVGSLKTLREGDIIATEARLSPEVKLKLNGRVLGTGELVACGDNFLVRVTQWFLHTSGTPGDTVNT